MHVHMRRSVLRPSFGLFVSTTCSLAGVISPLLAPCCFTSIQVFSLALTFVRGIVSRFVRGILIRFVRCSEAV